MEMSKKILYFSYASAVALSLSVIIGTFANYDVSNLTVVAGAVWGEVAVHTAVYSLKAKSENRLKILMSMIQSLSKLKQFEPEVIVELFNGVTQEG